MILLKAKKRGGTALLLFSMVDFYYIPKESIHHASMCEVIFYTSSIYIGIYLIQTKIYAFSTWKVSLQGYPTT